MRQAISASFGLAAILLSGCSLEAAMTSCATCGEVRSVTARVARSDIRLPSPLDAYAPAEAANASGEALVFHVRVRMDRGGSRDFFLPRADLNVGDRVEVRGDALIVRDAAGMRWS
jgi:hypothetical protein